MSSEDRETDRHTASLQEDLSKKPNLAPEMPHDIPPDRTIHLEDFEKYMEEVVISLESLSKGISVLNESFQKRLEYDSAKEKAFDRLYDELDNARRNQELHHLKPIFLDLLLLNDRAEGIITNHSTPQPGHRDHIARAHDSIYLELQEILNRYGVELIITEPYFNPQTQRAVETEPTTDSREHHEVVKVTRRGYTYNSRVLRAEDVIIRKLVATHENPKEN